MRPVVALVALVSVALAGAEEGHSWRRRGHLLAAARAYESGSPLAAAECFLRAGLPVDAMRCLRRVDSDVARAWLSWLQGLPVSVGHLRPHPGCPAAEAHLAGVLCRIAGHPKQEREWMRVAYEKQPDHPVYGADLCRAVESEVERRALLARIPAGSEKALVEAEIALRQGEKAKALSALAAAGPGARVESLLQLCGEKGDREPVDAKAYHAQIRVAPMALRIDRTRAKAEANGLTLEEHVARQWQSFFRKWRSGADDVIQAHRGRSAAVVTLRRRGAFLAFATHYGTLAGQAAQARAGLADLIGVIVADPQQLGLPQSLRALSMLWANLPTKHGFVATCRALRRRLVSESARAVALYEIAHHLRLVGLAGEAEESFAELVKTRAWGHSKQLTEKSIRMERLWAGWERERRPLPVASIRMLKGGERMLRARTGKLLLLEFFDADCAFCRRGVRTMREWKRTPRYAHLEVLAIGVDQSESQKREHASYGPLAWPVANDPRAEDTLKHAFDWDGTPSFCLVDSEGRVRAVAAGLYGLHYIRREFEAAERDG